MRGRKIAALIALALLAGGCAGLGGGGPRGLDAEPIPDLERRALEEPANPHWPYRLAQSREAEGDVAAAESALRSALALDPAHAPSLSLLSKIFWKSGRHEEAIAILEAYPDRNAMPDELALALALNYEAVERFDEAFELAQTLERGLSDWKSGGSAVAYLRLKGDEYVSSIDIARKALDAESSAVNHNNYGIALLYSGEPAAARKSFLTARKMDSSLPGPLYNLAIVDWFYFFESASAREWFREYRKLSDDDPDGLAEILTADAARGTPPLEENTE